MEKMILRAYTKQVNESKRTLIGVASTEVVDRYNDIIKQDGWILDNFRKNPVMLWSHNYNEPPIAKITDIRIENNQLIFEAQFPKKGVNELSDKIFEFYKEGLLNAFSVSFIPIKYEHNEYGGYTYTQQELLEISAVTVPANQEALAMAFKSMDEESQYKLLKSLGIKTLNLEEVFKGAVPSHESQKLDENSAWDATEAVTKLRKWASSDGTGDKDTIDWAKYKWGFAWYDAEDRENFGAYKLPHHTVDDNGVLVTVWRGVSAAMAALMGARGGVDIPDSDFDKVYNHLARHYREFDKEPPEKEFVFALRRCFKELNVVEGALMDVIIERKKDAKKLEELVEAFKNFMELHEKMTPEEEAEADHNGEEVPEFDEPEGEENLSEKLIEELRNFVKEVENNE